MVVQIHFLVVIVMIPFQGMPESIFVLVVIGMILLMEVLRDIVTGGAENDTITGGANNDSLTGNGGDDTFNVDSGTDVQ